MRLTTDTGKTWIAAGVGALLAALVGFFLDAYPVGRSVRYASYDLLHIWRGDVPADEAVLVEMDEVSHRELGQSYIKAWDRRIHAKLISLLTAAGAKVIVFDIVFNDPSDPAQDDELIQATEKSGRVVLAADRMRTAMRAAGIPICCGWRRN